MGYNMQALSDYYKSRTWAEKRNERLKIDGFKCARCGFTRALEVHHINYDRLYHEDVSRDLITLCKKCHKEIELQKKACDPVRAEHHSVYLAGKISKCGWRDKFPSVGIYDGMSCYQLGELSANANEELTITGPFFVSCDHGCYHGRGKHGVGAVDSLDSDEWGGCMGNFFNRSDVLYACKRQIDRAEIVFAYIDQDDCYGTLAEIGYAHAKEKDIVVVFSNDRLKRDMWFADKMQQRTGNISDRWIREQLLTRIQED